MELSTTTAAEDVPSRTGIVVTKVAKEIGLNGKCSRRVLNLSDRPLSYVWGTRLERTNDSFLIPFSVSL